MPLLTAKAASRRLLLTTLGTSLLAVPALVDQAADAATTTTASTGLDDAAKTDIAMRLVSSAENSPLSWEEQYTYIEDIGDGRGYTGGILARGTGPRLPGRLGQGRPYRLLPQGPARRTGPCLLRPGGHACHEGRPRHPRPVRVPAMRSTTASLRNGSGTLSAQSEATAKSPTTRASPVLAPAAGRVVVGQAWPVKLSGAIQGRISRVRPGENLGPAQSPAAIRASRRASSRVERAIASSSACSRRLFSTI